MSSGNSNFPYDHKHFTRSQNRDINGNNLVDSKFINDNVFKNANNDDDTDDDTDDDNEDNEDNEETDEDTEDNEDNEDNYRKFLATLYPSKHMKDKLIMVKCLNSIGKETLGHNILVDNKQTNLFQKNIKIYNRLGQANGEETDSEMEYSLTDKNNEDDDDADEDEEDEEEDDEEDEEDDEEDESEDEEEDNKKKNKRKTRRSVNHDNLNALTNLANALLKKRKKEGISKIINKSKSSNRKKDQELIKQKSKNLVEFKKLLEDKDNTNDIKFFKNSLSILDQEKILKELKYINECTIVEKPYRITMLESDIPAIFKTVVLKKISMLENMDPTVGEYFKIKTWVDYFMQIPFNKFSNLPITIDDGIDKCNEYMESSIKTLDEAVYGMNDAKMQIMQLIGQWISNPDAIGTALAIKGPMGVGKCHGINTPILMHNGIIKMVQDIQIGDIIMGDDSNPRNVIELGQGEDELYEVIPIKGEKYVVNSEHILCLHQSGKGSIKPIKNPCGSISYKTIRFNKQTYKMNYKNFKNVEEAERYLNTYENEDNIVEISVKNYLTLPKYIKKDWLKGYKVGVDFPNKKVMFDPYIIGLWLGDGSSNESRISNQDAPILKYLNIELKNYNLNLNYISKYDYGISAIKRGKKNIFLDVLKKYNLINNKHIPNDYKINDRKTQLQILAGLLDSDGYYSSISKCFEITQKSKQLSDDILYIVRSLGFAAYQKKCIKYCVYKNEKMYGTYFRITISGNNLEEIPTKCIRKQASKRNQIKNVLMTGITVNPIGPGKYYGFTIDSNHHYLLGDFTVTHNTTLVKDGISKILNRPFAMITLGGATDSAFLEGHSYTYEGSTWGKIVDILIQTKCSNPVIYFDELDKISDTPKGEEIIGILMHLIDSSQNSNYHDKYFSEIDFNLSKALFIFSYNDESKVNPILRDRMYRISTNGFDCKEKLVIANNYLLPKICEQVKFKKEDIIIPDDTLTNIIKTYTENEEGVRNLKRCLEIIFTKLNLFRLMKPESSLFKDEKSIRVEFPFIVTSSIVEKLLKNNNAGNMNWKNMYI